MTDQENKAVRDEVEVAVKKYAHLKVRDVADEIHNALVSAAQQQVEVEGFDEDARFEEIKAKYKDTCAECLSEVEAMLNLVDKKHSSIVKARDAAIRGVVQKFLADLPKPVAGV